jgi:GntR family transcriptional regulator, galactonate operon transcriptional repressor
VSPGNLHQRTTRALARQILEAESILAFPKEADLCAQLGVSRTVVRESMKVLADKGMVEMKPRAGTRSRPHSAWNLLDPDILAWQAETRPAADFLRDLCEVRLAIEPTAAGFAAVRATPGEIETIARCLEARAACGRRSVEEIVDLDLAFHSAVVAASHNPLLAQLSDTIRTPIRMAFACTARYRSVVELGLEAHRHLLGCLRRRDPMAARKAAEEVVGLAMLAIEKVVQARPRKKSSGGTAI